MHDERAPWEEDRLELPRWVQWIVVAFLVVPAGLYVGIGLFAGEQQLDPEERVAIEQLEDTLRPLGAAEDAVGRYEAAMQQIAGDLSAQQPGLTWQWQRQVSRFGCEGDLEDTTAVHMRTRHLVANQPIAGESWAAAHEVARRHASALGAGYVSGFKLADNTDGAIDLTQSDVAVLSGVTPCRLTRDELAAGE